MRAKHNKYSEDFLENAHKGSSLHKEEILSYEICGCFYCEQLYSPKEIVDWIEENYADGETAICPKCDIDSVLSQKYPIEDKEFLNAMNIKWFN